MTNLIKAQRFIATAPREALADALGLGAFAVLVFLGLTLPAFL